MTSRVHDLGATRLMPAASKWHLAVAAAQPLHMCRVVIMNRKQSKIYMVEIAATMCDMCRVPKQMSDMGESITGVF